MKSLDQQLSRRERQIMNVLFRKGEATVHDVAGGIPQPPSDTAIRTLMKILERKGHVRCRRRGRSNVYRPVQSSKKAARTALSGVLSTFFGGSFGEAMSAHLSDPSTRLDRKELDRLRRLIDDAKKAER